jgi:hypothetical protein
MASEYNTNYTASDLKKAEADIRKSLKSFNDLGAALTFIQDNDLHVLKNYEAGYKGFIKYCQDTFCIKQAYVYKMIQASSVMNILKDNNFKMLPGTESQCRPITRFLKDHYPEDIADCWGDFVNKYKDGLITWTAENIKKHFNEHFGVQKTTGKDSDTDFSGAGTDSSGAETDFSEAGTGFNKKDSEIEQLKQKLAVALRLKDEAEAENQRLSARVTELKMARMHTGNPDLNSPMAKKLFKAGFRKLAAELHPDKGGSTQDMQELLELKSKLGI